MKSNLTSMELISMWGATGTAVAQLLVNNFSNKKGTWAIGGPINYLLRDLDPKKETQRLGYLGAGRINISEFIQIYTDSVTDLGWGSAICFSVDGFTYRAPLHYINKLEECCTKYETQFGDLLLVDEDVMGIYEK